MKQKSAIASRAVLFALAALVLSADACDLPALAGVCERVIVEISGNHGHSVKVDARDVRKGFGGVHRLVGAAHQHAVALQSDNMDQLRRGERVRSRTSSAYGHVHEIELECAH